MKMLSFDSIINSLNLSIIRSIIANYIEPSGVWRSMEDADLILIEIEKEKLYWKIIEGTEDDLEGDGKIDIEKSRKVREMKRKNLKLNSSYPIYVSFEDPFG